MNNFSAEEQRRLADINNSIPQLLAGNILHDADGNPPVLLAGAEYNGIWLEHNQDCFFAADLFPDIAWNSQNIFMRHQQPDGLLPYAFRFNPFRVCVSQLQTVWPFARCALETARKLNRPEADFARIYEAGIRYDSWLKQYRSRNALGLVDMYCAFDTGHDNSRRVMDGGIPNPCPDKWAGNMPELPCMPIAAADLSAMRFGGLEALAELAEMLDKPQEAKELRVEAEMLKNGEGSVNSQGIYIHFPCVLNHIMGIVLLAYGNGDTKRISAYLHNCVANKAIILPVLPCGHDIKTITELEKSLVINHIITSLT